MKADFYLTRNRGLLTTATYLPGAVDVRVRMPARWMVPASSVPGSAPGAHVSTFTTVPASSLPRLRAADKGQLTSATAICGYRTSMHS